MKLTKLKKESERIEKKFQKLKESLITEILSSNKLSNKNYGVIKFSELNKKSLSVKDNILEFQIQDFIKLIENTQNLSQLITLIENYDKTMWEKCKIQILPKFNEIINNIKED